MNQAAQLVSFESGYWRRPDSLSGHSHQGDTARRSIRYASRDKNASILRTGALAMQIFP
jgi:hypothetical protein